MFVADKTCSPPVADRLGGDIRQRRELCVARAAVVGRRYRRHEGHIVRPRNAASARPFAAQHGIVEFDATVESAVVLDIGHDRHQLVLDQPSGRVGDAKLTLQAQRRIPAAPVPTLALCVTKCSIYNKQCLLFRYLDMERDSLGFLLADVSRLLRQSFQRRLEGSSLTLAQARALVYLSRHEGLRQVDLAEMLEVQPITLARLIDQLADAGLVERRADPADRRAYQMFLTPAAASHLAAIRQVTAAIQADALRDLNEQQAATLFVALRKMRDNLGSR